MHWQLLGILCLCCVASCFGSKGDARKLWKYARSDQQDKYIDGFVNFVEEEITPKASKVVELQEEYQRLLYGESYGMRLMAIITLQNGVTSKPTFKFVNATIVNYTTHHIEFNTRVAFDDLRLSYANCKLNISGMSHNGSLSAVVKNFQAVYSSLLDFNTDGKITWVRRSNRVLGNVPGSSVPDVHLELRENSRNRFVIYANMMESTDLVAIFQRQMLHVFDVVILDHVDQLYQTLNK